MTSHNNAHEDYCEMGGESQIILAETRKSSSITFREGCPAQLYGSLRAKSVPFITKTDGKWNQYAQTFNVRLPYEPCVVVLPKTPQHISDAIVCASEHGIKVQAKSGGHSYASFSNGGSDGAMMIHMSNFRKVTLDENNVAKVGGGTRLGPLSLAIYEQGRRALSHGSCPPVGVGGHYTHGGYGFFSRAWGLAMDQIVAMDVVLADGSYVHVDEASAQDATAGQEYDSWRKDSKIFYAMRGAADMFGIVVNFYLRTQPAPEKVVKWSYNLPEAAPSHSIKVAQATIMKLQDFAHNDLVVDRNLTFQIALSRDGFYAHGVYLGRKQKFEEDIAPHLLQEIPSPSETSVKELGWLETLQSLDSRGLHVDEPYDEHDNFYAKSVAVPEPGFSPESITHYMKFIATESQHAPVRWFALFDIYGGVDSQINKLDQPAAAYRDRNTCWVVQHYGAVEIAESFPQDGLEFINQLNRALTHESAECVAYMNYVDSEYDAEEAGEMYYGSRLIGRLRTLKRELDPQNIFAHPQSVQP